MIEITVNGRTHQIETDPSTPLLWVLRDLLALTGTKYGCGIGACGACTVLEGAEAVRSCQVELGTAAGKSYTTIEGLSASASHPCQLAWIEEQVAQCGYCQSGFLLATAALLARSPQPSDAEIDRALGDHLCRCGSYPRIRKAIARASGR